MGVVLTTVTGEDIYNAMVKDGFGALRGAWLSGDEHGRPTACLVGTAALNLGVIGSLGMLDQLPGFWNLPYEEQARIKSQPSLESQLNVIDNGFGGASNLASKLIGMFDAVIENPEQSWRDEGLYRFEDQWFDENDNLDVYDAKFNQDAEIAKIAYIDKYIEDHPQDDVDNEVWYEYGTWESVLVKAKEILAPVWQEKFKVAVYDYSVNFPALKEI